MIVKYYYIYESYSKKEKKFIRGITDIYECEKEDLIKLLFDTVITSFRIKELRLYIPSKEETYDYYGGSWSLPCSEDYNSFTQHWAKDKCDIIEAPLTLFPVP